MAADRLEGAAYVPIPLPKEEDDDVWGYSEAAGIYLFLMDGFFLFRGPSTKN